MANGTTVVINISGDEEVAKALASVALELRDLRPAMKDVGEYLKGFFANDVFVSRGTVIGHPWTRLSEPYASRKAMRYPGKGLLVRTGTMQRSFVYSTQPMQVEITNTAKHFVYHQSSDSRSIMPYRPMMDVKTDDARYARIKEIITARIARTIKDRGME